MKEFSSHIIWFNNWAENKIAMAKNSPEPLRLKLGHSHEVLKHASQISATITPCDREATLMAALYHDIGRFPQYLKFGTFKDAESINHGLAGVKIIKQERLLTYLNKTQKDLVLTAIACHNRANLPDKLPWLHKVICNIIRDSDKLDIIRIMTQHLTSGKPYNPTIILGLPHNDKPGNPLVREKILKCRIPLYSDLWNLNDFKSLLGAWFFDMHFEKSRKIFIHSGYGLKLIKTLPQDDHYGPLRNLLLDNCNE